MMNEISLNKEQRVPTVSWYQVPVVWIALFLFLGIILGCIHLIVVSSDLESKQHVEGEKYILGVPISESGLVEESQ